MVTDSTCTMNLEIQRPVQVLCFFCEAMNERKKEDLTESPDEIQLRNKGINRGIYIYRLKIAIKWK